MTAAKPRWRITLQTPPSPRIAVAGDSVLATCYGHGRIDTLACYALADGELRWQVELADFILGDGLGGVELVTDREGDAAYLVQDATVAAFAVATGAQRWRVRIPAEPPFESFTIAGAPVIAGTRLLLRSRRSRLVALDRRDGAIRFATDDREAAYDVVALAGVAVTRSLEGSEVRGHDLATGARLWQRPGGDGLAVARAPGDDDGVYLLRADGELLALEPWTGAVRWRAPAAATLRAAQIGPILVLAGDDGVRAVDAATGAPRWQVPGRGPALVAPLDGTTLLMVRADVTRALDVATGAGADHPGHRVGEHDRVIDVRPGGAIVTTDDGVARLCSLTRDGLREQQLGDDAVRPGAPAIHGVLQAIVTADGAVTLDTARDLARFVR